MELGILDDDLDLANGLDKYRKRAWLRKNHLYVDVDVDVGVGIGVDDDVDTMMMREWVVLRV